MNSAELRTTREGLGLTTQALADYLGIRERSVQRWEHGDRDIPDQVAREIRTLVAYTERAFADLVTLRRQTLELGHAAPIRVWRSDAEMHAHATPDARDDLPASWHRMMMHRLCVVFPDTELVYSGSDPS